MGHKIVDGRHPRPNALVVHLEKVVVEQKVEGFLLPCLPRVLVAAEARQQLRASSEARQIMRTANHTINQSINQIKKHYIS